MITSQLQKSQIIDQLFLKSNIFLKYLNSLSNEDYLLSKNQKWNAGQQLEHLVLVIKAIEQAYKLNKTILAEKFGRTSREGMSYEALMLLYKEKTLGGGKAPERFIPASETSQQRDELSKEMNLRVTALCKAIENFSEDDLDQYCIPHPILGLLTLREMLFNTIYHIEHHHVLAVQNLKNFKSFT